MTMGIGILGLAHAHVGSYAEQWRQWPDAVRVVAAWDHDADRLQEHARKLGLEPVADMQSLLQRSDVHAVVIGAETSMHADLVVMAAEAGKAIILQKPIALTMQQADRIVDAVDRASVPFTMAWQMRVDPQNLAIGALLQSGDFGRVYMVRRRHGLGTHLWGPDFARSWHADRTLNRGMWADDASHPIDLLLWLFGQPQSVTAEIATLHNPQVPDDHGIAIFRYADGMFAEVCSSFVTVAAENTMEVFAERGVIVQNYGDAPSAAAPRDPAAPGLKWFFQGDKQWHTSEIASPASQAHRIAALAQPLAQWLHGHRPALADARQGRAALRMVLASHAAAASGHRVEIARFTDDWIA